MERVVDRPSAIHWIEVVKMMAITTVGGLVMMAIWRKRQSDAPPDTRAVKGGKRW
ncbi:MAG: hypothetical protein ACREJQ_04945 [bacterium]